MLKDDGIEITNSFLFAKQVKLFCYRDLEKVAIRTNKRIPFVDIYIKSGMKEKFGFTLISDDDLDEMLKLLNSYGVKTERIR